MAFWWGRVARLNFVRLPDALFMCCYYGVYPWRWLRPRSTKTAATVLLQVTQRSEDVGARRAYLICAGSR